MASEVANNDSVIDTSVVLEDRLQGKSLENVRTSFIKPSTATPSEKEWMALSNLDHLWIPYYTPIICTFPLKEHRFGSADGVVRHLKASLAEALVLFYPLAGRVVTKDGPPRIHCNHAGAVFSEACVDVELAELKTDDFQPQPSLSGLAAAGLGDYPVLPTLDTGLPALVIQVTHFKCGGITLAACWAHPVADGQSGLHFMKSWSEIARGLEVSLLPVHRRDLVQPRNPPVDTNPFKPSAVSAGAQIVASRTKAEKDEDSKDAVENSAEVRSEGDNLENTSGTEAKAKESEIVPKIVEFTKDDIAKLKKLASDHDASVQLSRADCLSTHLWRTIARARNLSDHARTRLWILVEGRKKLSLPPGYFGNVIGMTIVITTVRELLNDPFGSTANLIHSALSTSTGERFQDLTDFMRLLRPGKNYSADDPVGPEGEIGASYLIRFPFYELDFGFGIPAHSMRNTMGAWDGINFIVPSSHPEHMVVMANLNIDVMSRFVSMARDIVE